MASARWLTDVEPGEGIRAAGLAAAGAAARLERAACRGVVTGLAGGGASSRAWCVDDTTEPEIRASGLRAKAAAAIGSGRAGVAVLRAEGGALLADATGAELRGALGIGRAGIA